MNLEKVLELYENLEEFLQKYGDNSVLQSYKFVKRTVGILREKGNREKKRNKLFIVTKHYFKIEVDCQNFMYGITILKLENL